MGRKLKFRRVNLTTDTTLERIGKFYSIRKTTIKLKPKEEEIRRWLHNMWDYLNGDKLTDRELVLAHVKWCEAEGIKISERTAYEDLKHARVFLGTA